MAQHLGFPWQDQEGAGTACNVLCFQVSCCVPVQREAQTEEKTHGKFSSTNYNI
jgi:hypothetical protein